MTYNKKNIKNIVVGLFTAIVLVGTMTGVNAATFNTSGGDSPVLRVSNYTQYPDSSAHWGISASANQNDVLSFLISYHNTSGEDACDVRIRLNLPSTISNGQAIPATVWADNASAVTGNVVVYTNFSGSRNISQVTGYDSVRWYAGPSSDLMTLPFSQSGTELLSTNGLRIGNIQPDRSGYIVARAQIGTQGQTSSVQPTAVTRSTANVSETTITLQGSGDPNNTSTDAWFEYGTTTSLGRTTSTSSLGSGDSEQDYSIYVSSLSSNTTYYYRAVTRNYNGTAYGSIYNFTTNQTQLQQGDAPLATTNVSSGISETSATLNGSVTPRNSYTDTWFEYGTTMSLGWTTVTQSVGSSNYSQLVQKNVSNLSVNMTYYYRVVARNSYGTTYGNIASFATGQGYMPAIGNTPYTTTYPASNIASTGVTLNGSVNSNGYSTNVWFEYGRTNTFGTRTVTNNVGSGTGLLNRYQNIGSLTANTTYYYRVVAQNAYGTSYGSVVTFTTVGAQTSASGVEYSGILASLSSIANKLANLSSSLTSSKNETYTAITVGEEQHVTFTLNSDKDKAKQGEEVTITAEIFSPVTLKNSKLVLTLDKNMGCENIFAAFPITDFTKQGETFTFDLGTIAANSIQTYKFNVTISKDTPIDSTVTATGVLLSQHADNGEQCSVSDAATITVASSNGFLANIFSGMFGGSIGRTILPLVVAILIAIGLVILGRKIIELIS
ncbi:MAG: fibronectin type III domain-containing protein [bacterium]